MERLAVFPGPQVAGARAARGAALRRRLKGARGTLEYEFVPAPGRTRLDPEGFAGALLPVDARTPPQAVGAARRTLPGRPVGGLVIAPDSRTLRKVHRLGLDFVVEAWRPADPPPEAVLAHLAGARRPPAGGRARGSLPQTTARRLAILTDVVKTANSILEPRKVIELVVEKIRELIPSEAWSLMMADEEKQELVFEAALGAKARDVSAVRLKIGEGVAGWVAQTGQPTIVNDATRDPR
ncbi:MAG TPA: GAF domain-containing protein, partial [Vicinamibacteria bacterium]|nr:GAF domain-containing protein [Vicinamibacteria bacterium]